MRAAKKTAKQIECDGGPVPAWPSPGYLYSYRCAGKVGSLLASAIAGLLLRPFASAPVASQYNGHKYGKLVQSAARGRFIAYELSYLSIAYPVPSDRVGSSPRSISRQCSILRTLVPRNKPHKSFHRYHGY